MAHTNTSRGMRQWMERQAASNGEDRIMDGDLERGDLAQYVRAWVEGYQGRPDVFAATRVLRLGYMDGRDWKRSRRVG